MIHTLLTTARSGSTWYGYVMAEKYNADFLGEIFHIEHMDEHKQNLLHTMKTFLGPEKNCVIKVFAQHLMYNKIANLQETILNNSHHVEILVRKSFNDQVKSLYIANEYEKLKNPNALVSQEPTYQDNFSEPFIINSIDMIAFDFIVNRIKSELIYLSKLYHNYNFKLSYLEDIKDQYKDYNTKIGKLNRPVVWNAELPTIDFDTASLF